MSRTAEQVTSALALARRAVAEDRAGGDPEQVAGLFLESAGVLCAVLGSLPEGSVAERVRELMERYERRGKELAATAKRRATADPGSAVGSGPRGASIGSGFREHRDLNAALAEDSAGPRSGLEVVLFPEEGVLRPFWLFSRVSRSFVGGCALLPGLFVPAEAWKVDVAAVPHLALKRRAISALRQALARMRPVVQVGTGASPDVVQEELQQLAAVALAVLRAFHGIIPGVLSQTEVLEEVEGKERGSRVRESGVEGVEGEQGGGEGGGEDAGSGGSGGGVFGGVTRMLSRTAAAAVASLTDATARQVTGAELAGYGAALKELSDDLHPLLKFIESVLRGDAKKRGVAPLPVTTPVSPSMFLPHPDTPIDPIVEDVIGLPRDCDAVRRPPLAPPAADAALTALPDLHHPQEAHLEAIAAILARRQKATHAIRTFAAALWYGLGTAVRRDVAAILAAFLDKASYDVRSGYA